MTELKATEKRVVISINLEGKNSHTFGDGTVIRVERKYNNLNLRETQPVNAFVIDSENIPAGAEVLISHNSLHDVNRIFGYKDSRSEDIVSDVKYYSIPEQDCFLWRLHVEQWSPCNGYATGLRLFLPYKGNLTGIEPKKLDNVLYITSGEFNGKVVHTLKACDYEIIFQGDDGREKRVIRCRHFENDINEREELIAIDDGMTKKVNNGDVLVGLSVSDCKPLKLYL